MNDNSFRPTIKFFICAIKNPLNFLKQTLYNPEIVDNRKKIFFQFCEVLPKYTGCYMHVKTLIPFLFLCLMLNTEPVYSFDCGVDSCDCGVVGDELAMGDSGVSYPQTAFCPRYNPAGFAVIGQRWDMEVGASFYTGRAKLKDSQIPLFNTSSGVFHHNWLPVSLWGICKEISPCLWVGISGDGTRTFKTTTKRNWAIFGLGKNQGVESIIPIFLPTLAWRINDCHQVGISVPIAIGRFKYKNLQNLRVLSETPSAVTNRGYEYAYGVALKFGWLWQINPCLTFGFMYQSKLLGATHLHKYRGIIPKRGLFEIPAQMRTGLTYQWYDWAFSVEGEYNWFKEARTLSNSPRSQHPLGSSKGPALGWKNVWVLHLAAEYRFTEDFKLQGGYTNQFKPLVHRSNLNANGVFYNPFLATQSLSIAASWKLFGLDCTLRYAHFINRHVTGEPDPSLFGGHIVATHSLNAITFKIGRCF